MVCFSCTMLDPKKINFNQLPKKFCDGMIGSFGKEIFFFGFTSGNTVDGFAATPRTMKTIMHKMQQQIQKYEKQFGVIDLTPSPIQSPLQAEDLKNSA